MSANQITSNTNILGFPKPQICNQLTCIHAETSCYIPCNNKCSPRCDEICKEGKSLCPTHYDIKEKKKKQDKEAAAAFIKNHFFLYKHYEDYDEYGGIPIYHFVNRKHLGGMSEEAFCKKYKKGLGLPDHIEDVEIWENDSLYSYVSY
jgi:hypothetical protein